MAAKLTRFRALRNFLRAAPDVHVRAGEVIECDDREAGLLVSLRCVEPVEARDKRRVLSHPGITWQKAAECEPLEMPRPVGAFARRA